MPRIYRGHAGARIAEKDIARVTHDADTGCYYICLKDKPCTEETILLLCQHKKDYQAFGKYYREIYYPNRGNG